MPIYEYHCPRCNEDFEILVFKKNEKVTCPKCDCKKVERLMSGFAHKNGADGKMTSSASGCASCTASSCASCH